MDSARQTRPVLQSKLSWVFRAEEKHEEPRKTKIVCTLGRDGSVETICKLIEAGMNVARMNFSHGSHESHGKVVTNIREASAKTGKTCAILLDTKGPEIRTGQLQGGNPVMLQTGQELEMVCSVDKSILGTAESIRVDYVNLPQVVNVGSVIKIDDGLIVCTVLGKGTDRVRVRVENTAELGQHKGVNLPGTIVDLPSLTTQDKADLKFGVEQGVDFIAASFTRRGSDIGDIKEILGEGGQNIKIICKIENQEGMDNFDEILEACDGIMVARGDLGVEIPIQKVCSAQKMMIRKCNAAGKPVITATQMLDSMITNPRPTRAEAGDVANAVFDGTDCVMLSGETAKGAYPIEAVQTMAQICITAEKAIDYPSSFIRIVEEDYKSGQLSRQETMTSSAVKMAMDQKAKIIVVHTETGQTGQYLSKYKPSIPVIVVTSNPQVARQSLVVRALFPHVVKDEEAADKDKARILAVKYAQTQGWVSQGELVVVTSRHTIKMVDA